MIKATIDGKPCLATGNVTWQLTEGVRPYVGRFDMIPEDVDQLREKEGAVELEISDGSQTVKFQQLYVIGDAPGPNPHVQTILLADRRYWWAYAHVLRRFNMRRHIGHKRIQADDLRELAAVEPNVWYAPYSLPGGDPDTQPWLALGGLLSVLNEVFKADPGGEPFLEIADIPGIDELSFENVTVDDNGQDAVARILQYIPGLGITLRADGAVVIYSKVDGAESRPLDEDWVELKNFGHQRKVDKRLIRPKEIHVLFTREFEIRVDFEDLGPGSTTDRAADEIWADNVMPMPDYQNAVLDVPRGTWVSFQEALDAWNDEGGFPNGVKLTTLMIRAAMVPYHSLWGYYGDLGKRDPDDDWASRIAAIQSHWRRTFRINRRFVDRTFGIFGYRLATINPETGTRAPAICYSDYSIIPGPRWAMDTAFKDELFFCTNVQGYPSGGNLDSTAKPAPATVQVIDRDQGIVQVDWRIDPSRTFEQIQPGFIETSVGAGSAGNKPQIPGPQGDLSQRQYNIAWNSVRSTGVADFARMSAGYKCIMMLTAVPASPNNDSQLERVVVRPQDVQDLLPDAMTEGLENAKGPIMEIRIGPGIETARVRWDDARREDIYQALGINNDEEQGDPVDISDLIINLDAGGQSSSNAASLQAIARASAAQVYATFADRAEGSAGYELKPNYKPEGRIMSVGFGVTPRGIPHTVVTVPDEFPKLDFHALMPASTRALLDKLAGKDD